MTQYPNITKIDGIERLPAGGIPGFCCETRDCPGCVRAYRRGLALLGETYGKSVPVAPRKPRKPTLASVAKQASQTGRHDYRRRRSARATARQRSGRMDRETCVCA